MSRQHLLTTSAGIRWDIEQTPEGTAFHSRQEVDHILDANKAMATHNDGYNQARTERRVASIPLALIQLWKDLEGWDAFNPDHADKLAQKLNDPDFQFLRTAPGRVSAKGGALR